MTSSPASKKAQAQSASIPFANSPFDDSDHLHFNSLHHDFNGESFSKFPHHQNTNHGVLRHPRPPTHSKVEINLDGCTNLTIFNQSLGSTLTSHNLFSKPFFQSQSVYLRFTHIMNMEPKFYIGSAMHHTLDREYSRSRKIFQLSNNRLVQAELALRHWKEHDSLYIWVPFPIYTERADYRCLELALIQEWQPRVNYPFISIYLSVLPPKERHPQETCLEHQCSIWFGHIVASLQTQVHSAGCQRHPCIGKIPTSIGTLDNHPRFGVKHQSTLRTDQDGGPTLKMCSLPVSGLLMSGWFCSLLWFLLLFCLVQRWSSRLVSGSNWCIQLRAWRLWRLWQSWTAPMVARSTTI